MVSSNFITGRPKEALLFWFFGTIRCGVWLCFVIVSRYKNRKYVIAGDHLYGEWLFTSLSLVVSLVVPDLVLSFFPRDVLDEIWN